MPLPCLITGGPEGIPFLEAVYCVLNSEKKVKSELFDVGCGLTKVCWQLIDYLIVIVE